MKDGIVKEWTYKRKKCVILWVRDHFCTYIQTKLKDVYYGQEYGHYDTSPESNIQAHGGITFSGELTSEPSLKGIYFYGCDYAHCGDYMEGMTHHDGDHHWTLEEVEKEAKDMANSIIQYEKIHGEFKKLFEEFKKRLNKLKHDAFCEGKDE